MLATTYTLGTSGNAAAYEKRFDEAAKTVFTVSGLAVNSSQELIIGQEQSNSGKLTGNKLELTWKRPVPSSTTGEVRVDRAVTVFKRAEFTTLTEFLAMAERQKTLLSDTTLLTKIFNGEQ